MNKTNKRIIILEESKNGTNKIFDSAEELSEEQYNALAECFIEGQKNIIYAYGEYNEDFDPDEFMDFWKAYQIGFLDGCTLALSSEEAEDDMKTEAGE